MAPPDPEEVERRARARAHIAAMKEDPDYARRHREKLRAKGIETRNLIINGRDIVAEILARAKPRNKIREIQPFRAALFGRAYGGLDDAIMAKQITNNICRSTSSMTFSALDPEDALPPLPVILDAWKLVYRDLRWIQDGESVQEAYETQLREEELQTPKERAKELVRMVEEKTARRNAKWFIPVLERLSSEEISHMEKEGVATLAIWEQISPAPPVWIQHIADTQQPWGFVFYKSSLVEERYGHHRWERVWEKIWSNTCLVMPRGYKDDVFHAHLLSIHCRENRKLLRDLWTEDWAPALPNNAVSDDELRK